MDLINGVYSTNNEQNFGKSIKFCFTPSFISTLGMTAPVGKGLKMV